MTRDDWYRNEVWNSEIEEGFLRKLSKARSQKDQYLKIQIHCLVNSYPREALRLCDLYRRTRSGNNWDLDVEAASAKAHEGLGEIDEAVIAYRNVLRHDENQPLFPHWALLDAAYLVATKGRKSDFPFAFEALERAKADLSRQAIRFPVSQFVLHASHAFIRFRTGQMGEAKDHASAALKLAGVSNSGLRFRRTVGLVGSEHHGTILALKSITTGHPRWLLRLMAKVS